jgi:hypothetical protein
LFDETTVDAIVDARDALLASQSRVLEQIAAGSDRTARRSRLNARSPVLSEEAMGSAP